MDIAGATVSGAGSVLASSGTITFNDAYSVAGTTILSGATVNFTATDNLDIAPGDYQPYCVTAPRDPRLPDGGGQQICGLYDIVPAKFGVATNNIFG